MNIDQFKSTKHLVTKGYSQQPSIDFNKIFVLIVCMNTIRIILAFDAQLKLQVYQLDVKSTFLNRKIEEVYVEQPSGYEVQGKEDKMYYLKKALYRPKQASRT